MSVHSKDGLNTWSTKLNRIGKLSAEQKDIVFNNIGHIIDLDMLKWLYNQLQGNKAVGIDEVTKSAYGENLDANLIGLLKRVRQNTYKPKPARLTMIPKEDGTMRPLAISCFEDKLVQLACSKVLDSIFEPLFLESSYGFRPNRSCHDALKALNRATFKNWNGAVVEIDIKQYFNRIPHEEMMCFLKHKVSDKRFLKLIDKLMKTPTVQGKRIIDNQRGCPQGSIISPILVNISSLCDRWFHSISQAHIRGRAEMVRYADDMVFTFEYMSEAKRFYEILPKRLKKFQLDMHRDKSSILPAGHVAAMRAKQAGDRLGNFKFLGFICYWGKSRKGYWTLRFTSRGDRFTSKLKAMKLYLRKHLTTNDTRGLIESVIRVVKGWANYHNISYNRRRVNSFIEASKRQLLRWFNRRGGRKPMSWKKFVKVLETHKFPNRGDFKVTSML